MSKMFDDLQRKKDKMNAGYTVSEIQDIIYNAIDNARDDKGLGIEDALDDLESLAKDLEEHSNIEIPFYNEDGSPYEDDSWESFQEAK